MRRPPWAARWTVTLLALVAVVPAACETNRGGTGGSIGSEGLADAPAAPSVTAVGQGGEPAWFTDQAEESGLDFVHFNGASGNVYFPEIMAAGAGFLDYDNDGDLDVYLVQGQMLGEGRTLSDALFPPGGPLPLKGRLYRNDLTVQEDGTRELRFTDVTDESALDARGYGMGVAAGDIDNDGWVDLYLTNFGPNQLFRNNRDGTFTDISSQSGTADPGWGVSAAFVDYDRDGWLDLYVGNYVSYELETGTTCTTTAGAPDYCSPQVYPPQPDRLYRNQGNGSFADVSGAALVGRPVGPALGVVTADFDGDGWIDIYVANDGQDNQLWMNQRDGTFRNMGLLSGVSVSGEGRAEAGMGVDAGDFDRDGDEDLFITHLRGQTNTLYINNGSGVFEDRSALTGIGSPSLGYTGFGTTWVDVDNDGWLDVLVVNGAVTTIQGLARVRHPFPYGQPNQLFRNVGHGRFEEITSLAGTAFQLAEVSRGAAFGDVDNDGDVDVLVSNTNGPVRLFINIGSRNRWVGLRLVGTSATGGRDMLGALVEISRRTGPTLWRRARADGSYASANDPRVLVGLGASPDPPRVRVRWPDGGRDEWREVPLDRWTTLRKGEGSTR